MIPRRNFIRAGIRGAAMLAFGVDAWKAFARGKESQGQYPVELRSLDDFTGGKISSGDLINKDNVKHVKNLLDPVRYRQVEEMGRVLKVVPSTFELDKLCPVDYLEATLRNKGMARLDNRGNVVTKDGSPWIGGNPFPEPESAEQVFAAHTLSWGRHDASLFVSKEYSLDETGTTRYEYASGWAEMACSARITLDPKPYWPAGTNKLRYQSVFFVEPADAKGIAYLSTWSYDQVQLPELVGYIPAFKRFRKFPTNQRFEPLNPGSELYLSDAWAAGDPYLTWGNYRIVSVAPFLGAVSGGWNGAHPNWEHKVHGGALGKTFWDTKVELVPEAILIEAEPTHFSRAPISKKRVWFDARTLMPLAMVSYDRQGKPFRFFDGAYGVYKEGTDVVLDGRNPYWSWCSLHAFNIQTNRMTRIEQVRQIPGGHRMRVNDQSIFERYLTTNGLQSL